MINQPTRIKKFFQDDQGIYHGKISDMITKNKCRVIVNINDLRRKNEKRASKYVCEIKLIFLYILCVDVFFICRLLTESFEELIAFQVRIFYFNDLGNQ